MDELEKYYQYLMGKGADVPPTFASFKSTLQDEVEAKKFYEYVKTNKFDAPDTYESFANTFGLKKKEDTPVTPKVSTRFAIGAEEISETPTNGYKQPTLQSELPKGTGSKAGELGTLKADKDGRIIEAYEKRTPSQVAKDIGATPARLPKEQPAEQFNPETFLAEDMAKAGLRADPTIDAGMQLADYNSKRTKQVGLEIAALGNQLLQHNQDKAVKRGDMPSPKLKIEQGFEKELYKDAEAEKIEKELAEKKSELEKISASVKHAASVYAATQTTDPVKAGRIVRTIQGDKTALNEERYEEKGLEDMVAQSEKFYNEKIGLEALKTGVEYQLSNGNITPEEAKGLEQQINLANKELWNKYPEYKQRQLSKMVAQQIMKDHPNAGGMMLLPYAAEAIEKLGLSKEDAALIDVDDLPIQSFGSSALGAVVNFLSDIGEGATRIGGTLSGYDKDYLDLSIAQGDRENTEIFEDVSTIAAQPTIVDNNPNSPTYLQDIPNPDKGKYNYNFHTMFNAVGHGIGQLVGFVGGAKVLGGISKGVIPALTEQAATQYGMAATMVGLGYEPYYQKARTDISDKPEDEWKRHSYSILNGMLDYIGIEVIGGLSKASNPARVELANTIKNIPSIKALTSEAVKSKLRKGVEKFIHNLTSASGESIKIGVGMDVSEVAKNIVDNLVGTPEAAEQSNKALGDNMQHRWAELAFTMALPLTGMHYIRGGKPSAMLNENMYDAGLRPSERKVQLNKEVAEGRMTPEEAQQRGQVINTMAEIVKNIPTDLNLNHNQKVAYAASKFKELALAAKSEGIEDAALSKFYKDKINEEVAEQTKILNGDKRKSFFEQDEVLNTPKAESQPNEGLDKTVSETTEGEVAKEELTPSEVKEWNDLSREEKLQLAKENLPEISELTTKEEMIEIANSRAKELLDKLHGEEKTVVEKPLEVVEEKTETPKEETITIEEKDGLSEQELNAVKEIEKGKSAVVINEQDGHIIEFDAADIMKGEYRKFGDLEILSKSEIDQHISEGGEVVKFKDISETTKGEPTEQRTGKEPPPPKEPTTETAPSEGDKFSDKGILNRLDKAENISEETKAAFREKGLKYKVASQAEATQIAKSVIESMGIEDAVTLAESNRFKGGVNSAIFGESLGKLKEMEDAAPTSDAKLKLAIQSAEIMTRYDEFARGSGQDISYIGEFYKKSPLGVQIRENMKRKEEFEQWAKPKEKSWKEVYDELIKEPEFEAVVKEEVKTELKKERATARQARIKKVDKFFDDAKDKFKGGAAYSTIIPPQIITAALEGMKQAYHAGEKVAKLIEDAVDYISDKMGGASWDKESFKKEWEEKLKEPTKRTLTDEEVKAKILDRFRKKLKGLSDREKEDVVRKSFQKIVESGGLDYADFRKIIADVTGRGEMTDAEAAKLRELVSETNKVDEASKRAREERTPEALKAFRDAELKAGKAARELNQLLYTRPNITKRLTSMLQLNTLGFAALVNNPVYNVINQLGIRLPVGVVKTGLDKAIHFVSKLMGKEVKPETDITSLRVQREFFKKLGFGTREAVQQFFTGLNRLDYIQKELHGEQIRPLTSMQELWDFAHGKKKLTKTQVVDKILQAMPQGWTAEIIARTLNLGDKPQRFAAQGAQASAFAKGLGIKDIDYDLFIEFPREEAYRVYKAKGLSDAEAGKKADYIRDTIIKEGERSTFQQDNFVNDILNRVFGKTSGVGGLVKATVISPYIKIPTNAYWSYFNIVNPEVAMLQSMLYGAKAYMKKDGGVKFRFDKENSTAAKDLNEAKYWFAHAAVGFATRAVITSLVASGIFRSANTEDDTKKEREGEQFYEQQGTVNLSKLWAKMKGENPDDVKGGYVIGNRWFGHWGSVGNTIAKREEEMTPEERQNRDDYWEEIMGNLKISSLQELEQGIFGNTSSLLTALNKGGDFMQRWGVNTINMFTNIAHPAVFAQVSKAELPYYTKTKADNFLGELKNAMLTRSSWLRKLTGEYPPSKIGIWGNPIEKEGNIVEKLFGFSQSDPDNFAQPIYEDYKRTNNVAFFPPAVKPEITVNGVKSKLNVAQTLELEEMVGKNRKALVAPFINDYATLDGDGYEGKDDEKLNKLKILYEMGFEKGKEEFIQKHPEFNKEEEAEKVKDESESSRKENKKFKKQAATY